MTNQSSDARAPLKVLFVCVENSNRSQMAEAFARIRRKASAGQGRRLDPNGKQLPDYKNLLE